MKGVIVTAGVSIMLLALVFGVVGCAPEESKLDKTAIKNTVEKIKTDMTKFKDAAETIHKKSDVIVFTEELPKEVRKMAETVHLSEHGFLFFKSYMEPAVDKLDDYKEEPEAKRKEILVTTGKIKGLLKECKDALTEPEFATVMELPVTGKSPDKLASKLVERPEVKEIAKCKEAADAVDSGMQKFKDASESMKDHLDELQGLIKTAGKIE